MSDNNSNSLLWFLAGLGIGASFRKRLGFCMRLPFRRLNEACDTIPSRRRS